MLFADNIVGEFISLFIYYNNLLINKYNKEKNKKITASLTFLLPILYIC